MDPISTALSIFKVALQGFEYAQSKGYLGGSSEWVTYANDFATIAQNFGSFLNDALSNPGLYDNLTEADIRLRLLPEGWEQKEARMRREMGKG